VTRLAGRVCAVLLGAAGLAAAHAGSYLRSADELGYSTSAGYSWATRQWDASRNLTPTSCRREYAYNSHFFEYGYSYYYTLFGGAMVANSSCGTDSNSGFGDLRVGIRGRTDLYRNNRAWELVATIPTERGNASPRLDCGAHGLRGALARKDELLPNLSFGSGIGVQLWESPLAHEVDADASLSGPLPVGRLRWEFSLQGTTTLDDSNTVNTSVSDCGTRGKRVKAGLKLGLSVSKGVYLDCAYGRAVWGEDATQTQGFSCGFSRTWE